MSNEIPCPHCSGDLSAYLAELLGKLAKPRKDGRVRSGFASMTPKRRRELALKGIASKRAKQKHQK